MLTRLRTRAAATLSLVWMVVFGAVGLSLGIRGPLLYRIPLRGTVLLDLLRYVAAWSITGGICGASFVLAVMALAQHRSLERLPSFRIAIVSALVGFFIGAITDPGYLAATVLAILAGASALASLQLAKHSRVGVQAT